MPITLIDFAVGRVCPKQKYCNTMQDYAAEEFECRQNKHTPLNMRNGYAYLCKL